MRRAVLRAVCFPSLCKKLWTAHERKSAQARAFEENREYLLPARFDRTEIPGVRGTVAYVDLKKVSPSELANLIDEKLSTAPRKDFFPPEPDVLFDHLGVKGERAKERAKERALHFFSMLRRTSLAERRVVFTVFRVGCPEEMPDNMHADLDWLQRHLGWPPAKIVQVASGLRSLGFETELRKHKKRGLHASRDETLVFRWYDGRIGVRGNMNGTDIAEAMVYLGTNLYCVDCGWRPLSALDFSQISSSTTNPHEHQRQLRERVPDRGSATAESEVPRRRLTRR